MGPTQKERPSSEDTDQETRCADKQEEWKNMCKAFVNPNVCHPTWVSLSSHFMGCLVLTVIIDIQESKV